MIKNSLRIRRTVAIVAALAVGTIGLAACGSSDDGDGGAPSTAPIRALLNAQPATLDPISGARSAQIVWATMLEPLVHTDANLEADKTGLITDWTRTDPTTWTFTLREGITFSNGEKADAEAAANTILLQRDTEKSILKSFLGNITDVTAEDPTTLVIKTELPQYNIADLLTTVYVVPPEYYEQEGPEGFSAAPVGTGPYVFDSSKAGREISVKKNPDYWGEEASNTGVVFTWATEAAQRLALLQSDTVDLAFDLPPAQAKQAEDAGIEVVSTESAVKIVAFLESTSAPFDDPELREAAALAIDRNGIVEGIFDGEAVADGGLLNVKPGTNPTESVEHDLDRAKTLVGDSSPEVTVTYPAAQYTNIEEVSQAVGGGLEAAGFTVKYNPLDYGSLVGQVVGRELTGIYIFAGVPNVAVPDFFASAFMKSVSITGNCPDPRMDELVGDALEQDSTEAAQPIYDELNRMGVVEKHCYVPLYKQIYNYGVADGVSGTEYSPLNAVDFSKTTH